MPTPFDDLSPIYEALIDWPKRLAHEEPFYRRLFEEVGARRVLDVACGTGRHAQMFHSWGLEVEGADLSPAMIAAAYGRCGEPAGLRWVVRGFDQPVQAQTPFDAAICVGNSLALAGDGATVGRTMAQMLAAVREGGAVVVQVLNAWALPDGPCVWQKSFRHRMPQGEGLILKGVHRCGGRAFVDLVVQSVESGQRLFAESVPFMALEASDLEQAAREAGAGRVEIAGGYHGQPYQRESSTDLVLTAFK